MKQSNVNNLNGYLDYLRVSVICNLVIAIPCLIILLGFKLVEPLFGLLFLAISLFINCPIASGVAWLIKGANKINKSMSLKIIGGIPGMLFGLLFGALVVSGLSNQSITIVSALLFFSVGTISGMMLSTKIGKRLLLQE